MISYTLQGISYIFTSIACSCNLRLLTLPMLFCRTGCSLQGGVLFLKKVLLKLSSILKFSQNLKVAKMIGNGTTSLVCTAMHIAIRISLGVVYCLYPLQRQCEKPKNIPGTERSVYLGMRLAVG